VTRTLSVELFSHPGCPLIQQTRVVLRECLEQTGVSATITERVGSHPSPTVHIDGVDVMGDPGLGPGVFACRIDTPTPIVLTAALLKAAVMSDAPKDVGPARRSHEDRSAPVSPGRVCG
jgi:hypothetical protein